MSTYCENIKNKIILAMLTGETRRPDCRYYESCVKKRKIVERTRDRRLARDEEKKN